MTTYGTPEQCEKAPGLFRDLRYLPHDILGDTKPVPAKIDSSRLPADNSDLKRKILDTIRS